MLEVQRSSHPQLCMSLTATAMGTLAPKIWLKRQEAVFSCAYHKGWETRAETVNFMQEITISKNMIPIPYDILKVLAFTSI